MLAFAKSARHCSSSRGVRVPDFAKRSIHARPVSFRFPPASFLPCNKVSAVRDHALRVSLTRFSMQLEIVANISLDEGRSLGARLYPPIHELFRLHPARPATRIFAQGEPHQCAVAPSPPAATFSSNFARENTGTAISHPSFHPSVRKAHRKANRQALVLPLRPNLLSKSLPPPLANAVGTSPQKIPRPLLAPSCKLVPAPNPPDATCLRIPRAGRNSIRPRSSAFERPFPARRKIPPHLGANAPPAPFRAIGGRVHSTLRAAGLRLPALFPLFSLLHPSGLRLRLPACPHPKHKPAEELWCAKLLVRAPDSFTLFVDRLRSGSQNNCPQSQLSASLRVYGKGYSALLAST